MGSHQQLHRLHESHGQAFGRMAGPEQLAFPQSTLFGPHLAPITPSRAEHSQVAALSGHSLRQKAGPRPCRSKELHSAHKPMLFDKDRPSTVYPLVGLWTPCQPQQPQHPCRTPVSWLLQTLALVSLEQYMYIPCLPANGGG